MSNELAESIVAPSDSLVVPAQDQGSIHTITVPDGDLRSSSGVELTRGEWLVLKVIEDSQTGVYDVDKPSVKRISKILGWKSNPEPKGVIARIRRLEAKGVIKTTPRFVDDPTKKSGKKRLTDLYEIVG